MQQPNRRGLAALLLATCAMGSPARAIDFGQIDDFSDGAVANWTEGFSSPNPPTNQLGGPAGASDQYLQDISSGIGSSGSKQIMINQSQWTGDFLNAHVTRMAADMENLGDNALYMRIALEGNGIWTSTNPVVLAPHTSWQHVTFDLSSAGMTPIFGTLSDTLSSVFEMRMLSSQFGNATNGDTLASTLGLDNLRALTLPGDADFDNTVATSDFVALAAHFNQAGQTWTNGDFNFDGTVNALDFNALATNFGKSVVIDPPMGTAVPEPGATMLIFAVGLISTRRRGGAIRCHPERTREGSRSGSGASRSWRSIAEYRSG
jgi:dockerin type I repeat protein